MKKLKALSAMFSVSGMKKSMIALFIGAFVAQGVSAVDFSWSAWGRAGWAPLIIEGGQAYDDDGNVKPGETATYLWTGSGPAWLGSSKDGWTDVGAAIGFSVKAQNEAETIGFQGNIRLNSATNIWYEPDNGAHVWVKPLDMLTIRVGMYQVDDLRGKLGGTNNNFVIGNRGGGEDDIFTRFESKQIGAHFKVVPIDNLQIHASFGTNNKYGATFDSNFKEDPNAFLDILSTARYGVGYTIPNIGFARVQFMGGTYGKNYFSNDTYKFDSKHKPYNQIQAAFQITAVENLNVDIGLTVPFQMKTVERYNKVVTSGDLVTIMVGGQEQKLSLSGKDDKYQAPISIAAAAQYTMGDLGLFFRVDTYFAEKYETTGGEWTGPFKLIVQVEPSYKIGDLGTVYGDVTFGFAGNSKTTEELKDGKMDLGLGVSFAKNLGSGATFNIGITSNIPVGGDGYDGDANKVTKARALKIGVPMVVTYSL